MNLKDLTVVAVITPKKPRPGRDKIEIFPNKSFLKSFKGKSIFFAETKFKQSEFLKFFDLPEVGGTNLGFYFQNKNSDSLFKENLLYNSGLVFQDIDYTESYKEVLNLENQISKLTSSSCTRVKNKMKADLLFAQTFKQAEFLLEEIKNSPKKVDVLYVNFVVGYSMHLLSNCNILFDVPLDFNYEKLQADIRFSFEAYKTNISWDKSKDPDLRGNWGLNKPFELFIVESNENQVKGFIVDNNGLQFFRGSLTGDLLKINTKYFVNCGLMPDRWHLVNCYSEKLMNFDLAKNSAFFMNSNGKLIKFSFEKIS